MTITVELNDEQTLALQRAQYRNGESLEHTLLRLAGLVPEPTPNKMPVYDLMSAQAQEELYRQEDARLLAAIEEWASIERRECAAVVAWLRKKAVDWGADGSMDFAADNIEDGEHRREEEP